MHRSLRLGVVGKCAVQHSGVVPDDYVVDLPRMAVGEALLSGPCEQFVEERPAFAGCIPTTWSAVAPEDE